MSREIVRARAYISGLGYYEFRINGDKVGDRLLDPGWTDYKKRVLYSTYDVSKCLKKGGNAIGIMLGNGRYIRAYGYDVPKAILQINIEFADGTTQSIFTDDTWKSASGPILLNDIWAGETYDARLERTGWDLPDYDDSNWDYIEKVEDPGGKLVSQASFPPIKIDRIIQPLSITSPKADVYIYDFGQNFVGWVRLLVSGPRDMQVTLRYAELLDDKEMLNVATNSRAKATDIYILKGDEMEVYEPHFTYHGFRYVEVSGFPGTPTLENIEGRVVHSAVEPMGGFSCSNPLINQIHKNVLWTQLNNLMSVPTDCPQRDERMGWMGDAQVSAEEAIYNFDMSGFYTKWMEDISDSQAENGSVPDFVPPYYGLYPGDPAWGTAYVVIPWYLYLYYGDRRILEKHYSGIRRWVDFLCSKTDNYIITYGRFGDWCPPGHIKPVDTPMELTSTWYYYHDALLTSRIACILGKPQDEEKYYELSERIKESFNVKFFREDCYAMGSQTSNVLPLFLNMVPRDKEKNVLKSLVSDISAMHGNHLDTGIIGTRYILDTLTRYGEAALAYKLVTQTTYPSWGYMIREGATTICERWEYLTESGMDFHGEMWSSSHNHIMFGTLDAWFYRVLAGISPDPAGPGFQRIIIKPYVIGDLEYVSASLRTVRGIVSSSWSKCNGSLKLNVTLPANSQSKVCIPKMELKNITIEESGETVWKNNSYTVGVEGINGGNEENGYVVFDVGSGSYSFKLSGILNRGKAR